MATLSPLDDTKTYRTVADAAYARKTANGVRNPKAVLTDQEEEAMGPDGKPAAQAAAVAASSPIKFTKGFSPAEKAAQRKALIEKIKSLDAAENEGE